MCNTGNRVNCFSMVLMWGRAVLIHSFSDASEIFANIICLQKNHPSCCFLCSRAYVVVTSTYPNSVYWFCICVNLVPARSRSVIRAPPYIIQLERCTRYAFAIQCRVSGTCTYAAGLASVRWVCEPVQESIWCRFGLDVKAACARVVYCVSSVLAYTLLCVCVGANQARAQFMIRLQSLSGLPRA